MHKMKHRLRARTNYGVLIAVAGCALLAPTNDGFAGQGYDTRYPMYPARQQQPVSQPAPAYAQPQPRYYETAPQAAVPYRQNIQPYAGHDVTPLYPERCAGAEQAETIFEFPAMEQVAPAAQAAAAPYAPVQPNNYPPATPYGQPSGYAPAYPAAPAAGGMINTSAEYRPNESGYPGGYPVSAPQDEMPVFRAYNTLETDRHMAFDRAKAAANRAPEYGYQQPRAPQSAPSINYQRQPLEEAPAPAYRAPQPQSYNAPVYNQPQPYASPNAPEAGYADDNYPRSQAPAYSAPRYSPAPNATAASNYRDPAYGYDEPATASQTQPPNREYRSAAQYYGQLQQQESEQALAPLEDMDTRNQPYDPRDFPSYSPAYPGGAAYPPVAAHSEAKPQDAPQNYGAMSQSRPPRESRRENSYNPNAAYDERNAAAYVPPVSQPYFERQPRLSAKTQDILSHLPKNIDTPTSAPQRKVDVDRFSADTSATLGTDPEKDKDNKASVENKNPSYNADLELEHAYELLMAGQSQSAIEIYKDILRRDKRNQDALFGLATTYHRMGDLQSALPVYGQLLKINPEHREALNNFLVLVSEESAVDALRELEQLERKNPDFSPIPAQLSILYDNLGQPDAARKKMMRAINLEPDNLVYKYNLAIMLDKQGKTRDAASLYRELMTASRQGKALPADAKNIEARLSYLASQGG